ncbi:MAG: CoA transferase [Acidimicrobiia bacterium]|nr:CoA transferase [Acidimicrobiia bacterium]
MQGIRVLEVASWTFVPMAGGVLADWGADVLKIEHPETGDPQRGLISSGLIPSGVANFAIEVPNRGKRSVAIDLTTDDGHQALLDLAATSDVFLTSILPEARAKLRIDLDAIRAVNPDIVYVRGSANGQKGPEAGRGGYDASTFWARGGAADICTPASVEYPVPPPGGAFGDVLGGLTIAGGISAALLHRERTGEALVVDCSLLAMGAWATSFSLAAAAAFGLDRMPMGVREQNANPLVNTYKTGDGRFLSLVMMQSDRFWPELVTTVGRPELIDDPRFVDAAARAENKAACYTVLDEIFASRPLAEWRVVLADTEGVWAAVQTPGEVLVDPQIVANGQVRDVVGADGSQFRLLAPPLTFDETPPDLGRGPDLGEHTDEVLTELGYDTDKLIDLKIKGAIL